MTRSLVNSKDFTVNLAGINFGGKPNNEFIWGEVNLEKNRKEVI